jgi:hypothetical protein
MTLYDLDCSCYAHHVVDRLGGRVHLQERKMKVGPRMKSEGRKVMVEIEAWTKFSALWKAVCD